MKRTRAANVTNCLIGTVVALLLSGSGSFVHAAVNTWTGTANDNWNMTGNWTTTNPGGVPVNGDSIVFSGTTPNNATDNDIGDLLVTGVTFDTTAASYTLNGDRIRLGWQTVPPPTGTGITYTGDIVNNSTNTQTINLPITLDPAKHVISTGTSRLNLHGANHAKQRARRPFSPTAAAALTLPVRAWPIPTASSAVGPRSAPIGPRSMAAAMSCPIRPTPRLMAVKPFPMAATNNIRVPVNGTPISITTPTTNMNSLVFGDGATASGAVQVVNVGAGNKIVLPQNGGFYNVTGANGNTIRSMTIGANLAEGGTLTAGDGVVPRRPSRSPARRSTWRPKARPERSRSTVPSRITATRKSAVVVRGGYVTPAGGVTNTFSGGLYVVSGRWSQPNAGNIGTGPVYVFPGGMINPGAGKPGDHRQRPVHRRQRHNGEQRPRRRAHVSEHDRQQHAPHRHGHVDGGRLDQLQRQHRSQSQRRHHGQDHRPRRVDDRLAHQQPMPMVPASL